MNKRLVRVLSDYSKYDFSEVTDTFSELDDVVEEHKSRKKGMNSNYRVRSL